MLPSRWTKRGLWPEIQATPAEMAAGIERVRRDGDGMSDAQRAKSVAPLAQRGVGAVAETFTCALLDAWGVAYEYVGDRNNPAADFLIDGVRFAVKCCGALGYYSDAHSVHVLDVHIPVMAGGRFLFWGIERRTHTFLTLGHISHERFTRESQPFARGDEPWPGFVASAPGRMLRVSRLDPPESLRRRAPRPTPRKRAEQVAFDFETLPVRRQSGALSPRYDLPTSTYHAARSWGRTPTGGRFGGAS